ncbi:MAG TPA: DHA2 family efflux MFS transporter permease subunit [Ilumatobacter sp.]|nr:DHA2 family efflux MFS transporter permease subunit [Ilumatobacter sp.]
MTKLKAPVVPAATDGARVRPRVVFVLTALGSFMAALDLSIVNVAFPDLEADFAGTKPATLAWVITAYSIVFGALLVTGGRTGDRLGRRRTFELGIGVFVTASLLCGLAPNVPLLIAARALQGVGAAFLVPASVALLISAFPAERRTQMVALWGGIGALAVATGPSLGAAIVSAGGWRWAFFVNIPVGVGVLLLGRTYLAESEREPSAARPDYAGVLLATVSVAAVVLAISEGPAWGWGSARFWLALGLGIVVGIAFVRRSRAHPSPVLDLALFGDRTFSTANAATLIYALAFFPMLLGNILFLTGVWDYTIMRAGLAVTPGPLVVAVVAGPAGKLAGRVGFRWVLLAGSLCMAAGLAWYAWQIDADRSYLAHWLPGTLVVGLGIGLTFPVLSAASVAGLPAHRYAVGSAVNQTARQVGGALGIAVLVVIIGSESAGVAGVSEFHRLWLWSAGAAVASGLIGATIPHRRPE